MPSLAEHQSNSYTKLLLLGDAKSGKTGSLVSLVAAGYKLRILDFDNLLDILKYKILEICPDKIDSVEFRTIRDRYKSGAQGSVIDGKPRAWIDAIKMLDQWKYDDVDLGTPANWGADCILVIDSLSRLCDAAYDFHESIIPRGRSGDFEDFVLEDVEQVVEVEDAKVVAGRDEGNEGPGLAGFGVAKEKEFGEAVGLVVSEGGH